MGQRLNILVIAVESKLGDAVLSFIVLLFDVKKTTVLQDIRPFLVGLYPCLRKIRLDGLLLNNREVHKCADISLLKILN